MHRDDDGRSRRGRRFRGDRDRGRRRRVDREEYYYEDDDYGYEDDYIVVEEERGSSRGGLVVGIIIAVVVLLVAGAIFTVMMRPSRRYVGQSYDSSMRRDRFQGPALKPATIKNPKIDLKAVEKALWETKTKDPKDFKGWMKKFENEVNAIYFATLKRQNPNADPTTLMKKPVRVDPQRKDGKLQIFGYIDNNGKPGYQGATTPPKKTTPTSPTNPANPLAPTTPGKGNLLDEGDTPKQGQPIDWQGPSGSPVIQAQPVQTDSAVATGGNDELLFAFKQTKPYQKGDRTLSYSLYDSAGYYYRQPGYTHVVPSGMTPFFMGFFMYSAWHAVWYRPTFVWFGSPGWYRTGFFYSRYNYYYRSYPAYRSYYRSTYYSRYRPWGWRRGSYYRRGPRGRYYRRGQYGRGYRGRYGRGYRSRGRYGRRGYRGGYRSRGRSGYRGGYRSRGRSGYRSRGRSGYRSRGYRGGYRSRGRSGGYRRSGGKW